MDSDVNWLVFKKKILYETIMSRKRSGYCSQLLRSLTCAFDRFDVRIKRIYTSNFIIMKFPHQFGTKN